MNKTSQRNIRAVEAFYDAERRRDIQAWAAFWREDGRHTFWLADGTAPIVGRDQLVATTQEKFDTRPPYHNDVTIEPLADPARVLARLHLHADEMPALSVHVWCLFHFDEAGLLAEIEEIVDTAQPAAN
jgi:limonene-1,2-epoxide hydrolase